VVGFTIPLGAARPWCGVNKTLVLGLIVLATLVIAALLLRTLGSLGQSHKTSFLAQSTHQLRLSGSAINAHQIWGHQRWLLLALPLIAWLTQSAITTVLVGLVVVVGPVLWIKRQRFIYTETLRHQLPDVVLVLAAGLRAGSGLWAVLEKIAHQYTGPVGIELERLLREYRLGQTLLVSLAGLQSRCACEEVRLFVAVVSAGQQTGGALAQPLQRIAASMRAKQALQAKVKTLTSQGRLQAIVMGVLPCLLLLMMFWVDPPTAGILLHTQGGQIALLVAGLLQLCGFLLVRRMMRIEV
jgi:tight adherence protein B